MQARPAFAHAQNLQRALIPLQRQQGGARFGLFGLESWDWLRLGMGRPKRNHHVPTPLLFHMSLIIIITIIDSVIKINNNNNITVLTAS